MMADPQQELSRVRQELEQVEQQIQQLLNQQNSLIQKKSQLEQLLKAGAQIDRSKKWDGTDFPWYQKLVEMRDSAFRISSFRPLQLQTINCTMSGKDCILIMPTGGGKSLCFQLPALICQGVTLVVSPLVSLMEDQVMSLKRNNIEAVLLSASSTKEEVKFVLDNLTNPRCPFRLLYVTPEKLAKSKRFMARVEKMFEAGLFSRLVIDEVHCCSQWGHDFRPDYKFLGVMRRQFPSVPILGLTATATSNVLQDVMKILGIEGCLTFRASFNRTNLFYEVRPKPSGSKNLLDEIQKLILSRFNNQSGIIYCLTQKDTEEVAKELQARGIASGCYHAYLDSKYRSRVHAEWVENKIKVVVATIAFGMGIDKPDVRFVIHHSMSKSMENYYQESGRAGRDDAKAYCILYAGFTDITRLSTMVFTEQTGQEKLYNMVQYAYDTNRCRRVLIAQHFGECWDSAQCERMCDQCNPRPGSPAYNSSNVTALCRDVIAIMQNAKQKDQRITAVKLMESVLGRGASVLRVSGLTPWKITQNNITRVLVHLILNKYLREDFHFTAYTTISYLLAGPKSTSLMSPDHKIEVSLEADSVSTDKKSAQTETHMTDNARAESSKSTSLKSKRQLVVINAEKSYFLANGSASRCASSGDKTDEKPLKKRKKNVIEIDDEDDDLEFGNIGESDDDILQSTEVRSGKQRCVVIESDDDL